MLYFAYGSNLSTVRLTGRVPSAELITTGQLRQHRLLFHKIGRDGSAKCDACFTEQEGDFLYGALYQIDPKQKNHLDQAEGLGNGYQTKQVTVITGSGNILTAFTYYATRTAADIKPFHWYKKHVLSGAREHCFPGPYIEKIAAIVSIDDKNLHRTERELSIYSTNRKV
jgi:hypothetical protein